MFSLTPVRPYRRARGTNPLSNYCTPLQRKNLLTVFALVRNESRRNYPGSFRRSEQFQMSKFNTVFPESRVRRISSLGLCFVLEIEMQQHWKCALPLVCETASFQWSRQSRNVCASETCRVLCHVIRVPQIPNVSLLLARAQSIGPFSVLSVL